MASLVLSDLLKTLKSTFGINKATFDASGLTAPRSFALPDVAGTVALARNAVIEAVVFGFTTNVATGDGAAYAVIPIALNGLNLVRVHARVITAGTTGITDVQIHNVTQVADMLSTKITIDSGETGSDTAATAAVIDTGNDDVATNDLLRIDVDAVSSTPPAGLLVTLEFA